jgi:hypothetical protein
LPYLDNRPQKIPKYTARFFFFLNFLSSLTCSKIWLIPLADNHQCGCTTKLEGKKTRGVSHCGLAIYSDLEAKEELWKLKYFIMQKYNLQKNPLKEGKILQNIITITNLKFQHKPKYHLSKFLI